MKIKEAKRIAWCAATATIQSLLDTGWPYVLEGDADPEESDEDLEKLHKSMEEILMFCNNKATTKKK